MNILLTSYAFLINLFPISKQLKENTYSNVMKSVFMALFFCFGAYSALTILASNIYGEKNIQQSLFDNLKNDSGISSIIVRSMFLVIFICNIPYLYFAGKLSLLNAIQEYRI